MIDNELQPYVESFIKEAASQGKEVVNYDTDVVFSDTLVNTSPNAVAECGKAEGFKVIHVKKSNWDASDAIVREVVMFHELGHCLLDRVHVNSNIPNTNMPGSVMYPYVLKSTLYASHRDYYMFEMFHVTPAVQ